MVRSLLLMVLGVGAAQAGPMQFTAQGRLLDVNGTPVQGQHLLDITLYDHPTDTLGHVLWSAPFSETIQNGYYAAVLDEEPDGDGLQPAWFGSDVWLGVSVDGAPELGPRTLLSAVPSAGVTHGVPLSMTSPTGPCARGQVLYDVSQGELRVCTSGDWTLETVVMNGARRWSDGSTASSCLGYLNPPNPNTYVAATVSGVYSIDPDGQGAADVYCDMVTDSGGWTLLGVISGGDADSWNEEIGNWGNNTVFGTPSNTGGDHKSVAWTRLDIAGAELMYERSYSGTPVAQVKMSTACLHGRSIFRDLFVSGWDLSLRCSSSELTPLLVPTNDDGIASSSYREGTSSGFASSASNGLCWHGGDTTTNDFRGKMVWGPSSYGSSCYNSGHSGGIAVYTNGDAQYSNADIDGVNWTNTATRVNNDIALYVR